MIGFLLLLVCSDMLAANVPTGLLCDFQKHPALGVRAEPRFTWIVPPCAKGPDHQQVSYQLTVSSNGQQVWDSGKVDSKDSTYVEYAGPNLMSGTPYQWTVTTWTIQQGGGSPCKSAPSTLATFITALFSGWDPTAQFISQNNATATFGYFRKEINIPSGVVSASAFITAPIEKHLLSGYKLFINGDLIDVGPGRGEAPVWGGDGQFKSLPYTTLDVTSHLNTPGTSAIALQVMNKNPTVIMQLHLHLKSKKLVTLVTNESWMGFNGDLHRKPGPPQHEHSAGNVFLEYIDARYEPVGWKLANFKADHNWSPATGKVPSTSQVQNFHPKMEPPMQVTNVAVQSLIPVAPIPPPTPVACAVVPENHEQLFSCPGGKLILGVVFASFGTPKGSCPDHLTKDVKCDSNTTMKIVEQHCVGKMSCQLKANRNVFGDPCSNVPKSLAVELKCSPVPPTPVPVTESYLADFGRELQGGMRLIVKGGKAGETVHITCGESLKNHIVGTTWGWEFDWTLRHGDQVLEQHKYMECRFVSLTFFSLPSNFTLDAWKVHYTWYETDTHFTSSNAILDAVWELSRYTLDAASLDTYTDSNTRERRPYEADGIISAAGRLLLQRDYLWPRHSHSFVLQNPTWPVEWRQLSPFLGWQDYMATGQPDLSLAYMEQMYNRTMIGYLDSTGLLDTSHMGNHLVDWDPDGIGSDETVKRGEFTASKHMSVTNMYATHGLNLLAKMMTVGGRKDNATRFAMASANLKKVMMDKMWNGTAFCDGICSEVKGHSLVMSNMFSLCFGLVPKEHIPSVWDTVTRWGLEQIGDYAAFWYQMAISSSYFAPLFDTPDDGSAIYKALTKCDRYSWCSGLRDDNLTMTRESWHNGTYSHEWGASPIVGVVWGLMGVHQTAPGFSTFTVKPKLGGLTHASITVPTIRGYINVTASPSTVEVSVPCNSVAMLCLPRSKQDQGTFLTPQSARLLLDGREVSAVNSGGHLCASDGVSCGTDGTPRRLSSQLRE